MENLENHLDELLTLEDAAELIGLSHAALRAHRWRDGQADRPLLGAIPVIRYSARRLRVRRSAVNAYLLDPEAAIAAYESEVPTAATTAAK